MKKFFNRLVHSERINLFILLFASSEMGLSSISVAYYLLLSIFPVLLIISNILPYLHIDVTQVLKFMQNNFPPELYKMTAGLIRQVLSQPNNSLLTISIVLALWTFAKAMSALQMAMNKAYGVNKHRDFFVSRFFGIVGGFVIMVLLYLSVATATFGQAILSQIYQNFPFDKNVYDLLRNSSLPVVAVVTFVILVILYIAMPNIRIPKFRYILPGTIFSLVVLIMFPSLVGHYVDSALRTVRDLRLVGSLVIFAIMIWFIFISRVLIIGAMLNATYQKYREGSIETRRGELVEFIKELRKDTKND